MQTPNTREDYLILVEAIFNHSKKCQSSEKYAPFCINFILNLLTTQAIDFQFRTNRSQIVHDKLEIFTYIFDYIETYFLQNYNPNQIPFLYAIILQKKGLLFRYAASIRTCPIHANNKAIKYFETSLQFFDIYQRQFKDNRLNDLSKVVNKKLRKWNIFSTLQGSVLINLVTIYDDMKNRTMMMTMMCKSCKYFIVDHNMYSCYSDTGHISFDFVILLIRKLLYWDWNNDVKYKHQKRYKYLMKIGLKTLKNMYTSTRGSNAHLNSSKYGSLVALLGEYYLLFENNINKSRKLIYQGMYIIRNYNIYRFELRDIYDLLIMIEKACCNTKQCKNVLQMSLDFNKHYKLTEYNKRDISDLQTVKHLHSWSRIRKQQYLLYCMQMRKKARMCDISDRHIFQCINYVKNQTFYRVLKNLVTCKQCNYFKCKAKDQKLATCSQCKSVYYCNRKHQKIDWKIKHRFECQHKLQRDINFSLMRHMLFVPS
eukprot:275363_1